MEVSEEFSNRCWNAHRGTDFIEGNVSNYMEKQLGWAEVSDDGYMCEWASSAMK